MNPDSSNMPTPLLAFIVVLVLIQLTLQVIALVILAKAHKGAAGVPKLGWVAIILLGQMIGPLVFIILERKDAKARSQRSEFSVQESRSQSESIRGTIDQLYGES